MRKSRSLAMTMLGLASLAAVAGTMVALAASGAHAQPWRHEFYGRDFHHFSPREVAIWRGGRWVHDWHVNRFGWWWVVGGVWYFYPEPIYPYPTYVPPAVVMQQPPPVPSGLPPVQSWYYCDNPRGYYPYVASCATPWRAVPVTPPGPSVLAPG